MLIGTTILWYIGFKWKYLTENQNEIFQIENSLVGLKFYDSDEGQYGASIGLLQLF